MNGFHLKMVCYLTSKRRVKSDYKTETVVLTDSVDHTVIIKYVSCLVSCGWKAVLSVQLSQ